MAYEDNLKRAVRQWMTKNPEIKEIKIIRDIKSKNVLEDRLELYVTNGEGYHLMPATCDRLESILREYFSGEEDMDKQEVQIARQNAFEAIHDEITTKFRGVLEEQLRKKRNLISTGEGIIAELSKAIREAKTKRAPPPIPPPDEHGVVTIDSDELISDMEEDDE